jgi:hypothetical protein
MSQKKIKAARRHIREWCREHKRRVDNGEPGMYIEELLNYDPKVVRKIMKQELGGIKK